LQKAVAIENDLNYNEPPDWFFSVRHHLGAIQIEGGRYDDAIKTYEADLKRLPKNGWAHHGLKLAYQKIGNKVKVKEMEKLIVKSWATADVKITTSRIK
jgi:tetratricopeptide (TPR) repeat protein